MSWRCATSLRSPHLISVLVRLHPAFTVLLCVNGALWIWQDEIRAELDQKKVFLQGCDTQGRPVTVVVVNKHIPRCPADTKRCAALECVSWTLIIGFVTTLEAIESQKLRVSDAAATAAAVTLLVLTL